MSPMQEQKDRSRRHADTVGTLFAGETKVWTLSAVNDPLNFDPADGDTTNPPGGLVRDDFQTLLSFGPGVSNETPDDEEDDDLMDLVNATLKEMGEMSLTQISQDLQKFVANEPDDDEVEPDHRVG